MDRDKVERRVWFPGWARVLAQEPWSEGQQEAYRRVIARYLHECKKRGWAVSAASARRFMETVERERQPPAAKLAKWKHGLNWYFRRAARAGATVEAPAASGQPAQAGAAGGLVMSDAPTWGQADLGRTEWEQRLIRQLGRSSARGAPSRRIGIGRGGLRSVLRHGQWSWPRRQRCGSLFGV